MSTGERILEFVAAFRGGLDETNMREESET